MQKTDRGWRKKEGRSTYACVNMQEVRIASKSFGQSKGSRGRSKIVPINAVMYTPRAQSKTLLFVTKTGFDREQSLVEKAAKDIRTVILPLTIREVREDAFKNTHLKSVVLNEGLEVLKRVFSGAEIRKIVLPKTLREIRDNTFCSCKSLETV